MKMLARQSRERDWEELGEMDPLYAVLSHDDKKFGKWDESDFFATGKKEVALLMERAASLGHPCERGVALDFGCGVGRLTRALAEYAREVVGVDISATMIARAKALHQQFPRCHFEHRRESDLSVFADKTFDLIYSSIVLQHMADRGAVKNIIREFVRVLKPNGLLAFQIPVEIPWRSCLQPQQRLYHLLRTLGFSAERLYRWNLHPISMNALQEGIVRTVIERAGGRILAVDKNEFCGPRVESRMFYATKGSENPHVLRRTK